MSFSLPWLQLRDAVFLRKRSLVVFLTAVTCFSAVFGWFWTDSQASVNIFRVATGSVNSLDTSVQQLRDILRSSGFLEVVQRDLGLGQWEVSHFQIDIFASTQKRDCLELRVRSKKSSQKNLRYAQGIAELLVEAHLQGQARDAKAKSAILDQRVDQIESDLSKVEAQLLARNPSTDLIPGGVDQALQHRSQLQQKREQLLGKISALDAKIKESANTYLRQSPALHSAREELAKALLRYTEEHPLVKELRAAVQAAESRIKTFDTDSLSNLDLIQAHLPPGLNEQLQELKEQHAALKSELSETDQRQTQFEADLKELPIRRLEYTRLKSRHESLMLSHQELAAERERLALQIDHPLSSLEVLGKAFFAGNLRSRWIQSMCFGGWGGIVALIVGSLSIWIHELLYGQIRSPGVLARVTGLPVIATMGDLTLMNERERDRWAFHTFALLKGRFSSSSRDPLVCGFISSGPGEGRSTWVNLLAQAAKKQGHPVLTITSDMPDESLDKKDVTICSSPAIISETAVLSRCQNQPIMNIPIPGKIWDLELRRQWQGALQRWKEIQELIVLVELPPASSPEGVLLSEEFPNLIWLADSQKAKTNETRSRIEVIHSSRARLIGAVLNRDSQMKSLCSLALISALLLFSSIEAFTQEVAPKLASPPTLPANPVQSAGDLSLTRTAEVQDLKGSFSITSPDQLAGWQTHFTLGPGDTMNISLYSKADSARNGIFIGPDGRLTYLQAQDIHAAGLTVEELRASLEVALSKYFLAPRVIIQPVAFNSKKYYVLGNVTQKGVFLLNRPITILEAIAQAGGFATTLQNRNTLLLADLSRSFLVRKQQDGQFEKISIDFERLFLGGDLAQNIALAPDDYLYFPPLDLQEIYIIGAVKAPGPLIYTPDLTILAAIASKGGYIEKAYRSRVLVVRGSLTHPQTFIVDTASMLAARASDFELKPRDIVYISRRPWAKVEELLELAVREFARAAVITWTGNNIRIID